MEVCGKSMVAAPSNVIYLSSILGQYGPIPGHRCNWKCENEHVCGNMYRCKLTGLTHICDKNCNQRILYDNHSSLCLASGQIFPLTSAEEQAVRGVRRKLDAENSPSDSCGFKRRRDAQLHPSPFERSFSAVSPICSQVGDGMDMKLRFSPDCHMNKVVGIATPESFFAEVWRSQQKLWNYKEFKD